MSKTFYRAFEDRHRGSRGLIAKRLEVYLPFVSPLKTLYSTCPVLDLGCGRGEWLELLQAQGFSPRGVDLDDGMLEACWALELVAEHNDALTALAALDDNSQAVVSAFHLVEHISFSDVQKLVSEALRVLKPAGLLIMETPNAENLVVGTSSFFLDPTHEKPVPLDLLGFLAEYSGFSRTKVVRLQEEPSLHGSQHLTLMDVLGGASPDYAIVAQKSATAEQLADFDACFDRGYGVSLESLAVRYEQQLQLRSQEAFDKLHLPEFQEQLVDIKAELQLVRQRQDEFQLPVLQEQLVEIKAELKQVREQHDEAFEKFQLPALQEEFLRLSTELQLVREQRSETFEKFQLPALHEQLKHIKEELQQVREQRDEAFESFQIPAVREQLAHIKAELQQVREQRDEAFEKFQLPALQEQLVHIKAEFEQSRQQRDEALEKYQLPALGEQLVGIKAELQRARQQRDDVVETAHYSAQQDQLTAIEAQLEHARQERDEALAKAHEFWLKSCADESTVHALTSSTSWRMTAPLRWSVHTVRVLPGAFAKALKNAPRRVLIGGVRFVLARPALLQGLNNAIKLSPRLHGAFKNFAHNNGVITDATLGANQATDISVPQYLDGLSVEARQIYHDLKKVIDQKDLG
ncbi:chromosome segregation ATPase [Pseudomonas sp. M47T1]|uniref:class I SAM-dependent methyltransferase n=1 Tax=Pseudomonas sp. M47T1 TaxID=1179778 RepID=UPI000260803B|nr:class I SAM-dependent methyltransferase [Pseudomonas sp. M47T1]EIK95636.1 chromosome segregation ATPase [Pseudomonas sp. M47T1]